MKAGNGTWLNLLAGIAVAALLPGASGIIPFAGTSHPDRGIARARFHAGKRGGERNAESACAGKGCHAPFSHRNGGGEAAFRNMHEESVSCMACHGKDHETRWTALPSGTGGAMRLSYSQADPGKGPHDALEPPARCERCHSEGGKERLAAVGLKELPQGFASPIPMRMLREGGRKWFPDDGR